MKNAIVAAMLGIGSFMVADAAIAQGQAGAAGIARLQDTQGNVLVSQGDSMAAGTKNQALPAGTRVITTAGSRATIAFNNGCVVKLEENKRFTVAERDKCAAIAPNLGRATTFAVVAAAAVNNTGATTIDGDLGVSPGTEITGFPQGIVNQGKLHANDELATQARDDVARAYRELSTQKCSINLAGQDLGGLTLTPGVYCFPGVSALLTGELLLDNGGDPTAVFVFQVDGSLTTSAKSSVRVINGRRPADPAETARPARERKRSLADCNIYWQIGSSATLGQGTVFVGNVFAQNGVTAAPDASVLSGRALAITGGVRMNTNAIDTTVCFPPVPGFRGVEALAAPAVLGAGAIYGATRPTGTSSVSPN